jgi:hypothetical protein
MLATDCEKTHARNTRCLRLVAVNYFSVLAATDGPDELEAMLDVYDATRTVAPYRSYLAPDDIKNDPGSDVHVETIDGVPAYYYLRTTNPEGEHAGWQIGGQWRLHFKPRDPAHPDLIRAPDPGPAGYPAPSGYPERRWTDWVAGGPKRTLDIDGTRDAVAAHAARRWDRFDAERRSGMDRDAHVRRERDRAIPGYALLTEAGEWVKGDAVLYRDQVNAYVDQLPDDTWLFIVECHF